MTRSPSLLPSLLLLAALLAPASPGQAPQVDAVSPASGTLGTELVITGSGFSGARPRCSWSSATRRPTRTACA